jgi:hypothetical protein
MYIPDPRLLAEARRERRFLRVSGLVAAVLGLSPAFGFAAATAVTQLTSR